MDVIFVKGMRMDALSVRIFFLKFSFLFLHLLQKFFLLLLSATLELDLLEKYHSFV